jgi:dTMP kinase
MRNEEKTIKRGYLIVCEGSNGAGKTTVIKAIEEHLASKGQETVVTREPGGTSIGEKIREVILSPDTPEMHDTTELLLFAAARAQHVREKILPAIESGKVVISDRFDASTISFQHYARGLSLELVNQLNDIALDGFKSDITILLDLDPSIGLERIHSRGGELDRLEKERIPFLEKARRGYLEQADRNPERFVVIDASQSLNKVLSDVLAVVDSIVEG